MTIVDPLRQAIDVFKVNCDGEGLTACVEFFLQNMQSFLFTWNLFMENNGRLCFWLASCPISSPRCRPWHELRHFTQVIVRWKVFCVIVGTRFRYSDAKVRKCVALKLCLRAVQMSLKANLVHGRFLTCMPRSQPSHHGCKSVIFTYVRVLQF